MYPYVSNKGIIMDQILVQYLEGQVFIVYMYFVQSLYIYGLWENVGETDGRK